MKKFSKIKFVTAIIMAVCFPLAGLTQDTEIRVESSSQMETEVTGTISAFYAKAADAVAKDDPAIVAATEEAQDKYRAVVLWSGINEAGDECWANNDRSFYHRNKQDNMPKGVKKLSGKDECSSALRQARMYQTSLALQNAGIDSSRIFYLEVPKSSTGPFNNLFEKNTVYIWVPLRRAISGANAQMNLHFDGNSLGYYLQVTQTDQCGYFRSDINGKILKISNACEATGPFVATPQTNNDPSPSPPDPSFCKEHPYLCGIGGTAIVLGLVYGLLCIEGGDATKDGKTAEGGRIGGCWLDGGH